MNISGFDPEQSSQQFMNLLVAQIQYQDPLEPVAQEDITAQLAQISTVSGINELNVKFSEMLQLQTLFEGSRLVGNYVEYEAPETGEVREGEITEVRARDGRFVFSVNNEEIELSNVQAISSP